MTPLIITLARSPKKVFHKNASEVSFAAGPVHGTRMAIKTMLTLRVQVRKKLCFRPQDAKLSLVLGT